MDKEKGLCSEKGVPAVDKEKGLCSERGVSAADKEKGPCSEKGVSAVDKVALDAEDGDPAVDKRGPDEVEALLLMRMLLMHVRTLLYCVFCTAFTTTCGVLACGRH